MSVALEKQQVVALSERMDQLLDELMQADTRGVVPAVPPVALEDAEPLEQPIVEEFRAGTMTLSWDPDDERIVVEVFPYTEAAVVSPRAGRRGPRGAGARGAAGRPAARRRGPVVRPAGREGRRARAGPSCPFCGGPVDPEGHLCVRANGFKRRDP